MPIYPYQCACGQLFERHEPANGEHTIATCECGKTATRVWTAPYAVVDNTPAHFNAGLGCKVSSRADIKDAMRRYNGETGGNLLEMGTETKWRASPPKRQEYETASQLGIA